METMRGDFLISSDKNRLQVDMIHRDRKAAPGK